MKKLLGLFIAVLLGNISVQAQQCVPAPSGMVGWWKGDGNAADALAGNNGTFVNENYTTGMVGQAFHFDGNSGGVILADQPAYALTNSLTIEGWIRPVGSGAKIFVRGDSRPGLDPYELSMEYDNKFYFHINQSDNTGVIINSGPISYNQWVHVAATLDGSTGTMSLYTNGVLAAQTTTTVRPFGPLVASDSPGVGIGNVNFSGINFPFNGDIDEIALYNRALSQAEIQSIYNAGSAGKCPLASVPSSVPSPDGMVGWWKGEGNANDTINGNNGIAQSVTYSTGEVGQAFVFNGSGSSYIRVPASSNLDVGQGNGFTIELWCNPTTTNNNGLPLTLLEWNNNSGAFTGIGCHLEFYDGGRILGDIVDPQTGNDHDLMSPGGNVTPGVWQHVAMTYDKTTGILALYQNGNMVASQNVGVWTPSTSYDLYFGIRPAGVFAPIPFSGSMDEISLYNRALPPSEIQSIYNAGSAGKSASSSPPYIITQPASQSVAVGSDATLSVVAAGTSPLNYQWSCGGTNIANATNATLTLNNVQLNQAGNYAVQVSNGIGSTISSNALLTVVATTGGNGLVLWNKLGGDMEISNSAYGPNLQKYSDLGGGSSIDIAANTTYGPGVFGGALTIGPGNYFSESRVHNIVFNNLTQYLNTDRGSIDVWFKQMSSPTPYQNGAIRLFDGAFGLNSGISLDSLPSPDNLRFGLSFGGTMTIVNCNISALNGSWINVAGVWDRAGIDGTADKLRLYVNGQVVGASTNATWGNTVGAMADIGGGQDWDCAGQFYEDNLKVYNRALSSNEVVQVYIGGETSGQGAVAPSITSQPASQTVNAGDSASFSVVAMGSLPLAYQWSFKGNAIAGATNATLTLTNLHVNQTGNYQVTVSSAYGAVASSKATLTVIAQNILIYSYTGTEKVATAGHEYAYGYSGQMYFNPDNTNGIFVGWGVIGGKKQYWVSPFSNYLLSTIHGSSGRIYTVLGKAGDGIDENGRPNIWSYLHKGQNATLNIGSQKQFSFPAEFNCAITRVYPDPATGNMILREATSTYNFSPPTTQNANNTGKTVWDLVNAQVKILNQQGYQKQ
jgi:hypothetical protein